MIEMNLKRILIFCVIFLVKLCYCDDEGFFTVVGSKLMRQSIPYRVAVHYENYDSEKILRVGIKNDIFSDYKNVSLINDGDQEVILNPPDKLKGVYTLEVKSVTGNYFESSRKIQISRKQFSVFIQLDKSIYKPADKVQFRVLLLNDELRPLIASRVEIFITDGANNRVKQFDKVKFNRGIYQNELQLSDLPVMGEWKINVKVNNQKEISKSFDVAEYVLPKFEFLIDANPDANYKDGKITATVRAKYTFGKVAKGNATITAEGPKSYYDNSKKVTKSIQVDGKKYVEFDIEKELGITKSNSEKTVNLFATFTEELSGKEQNATAKVQIHITPHKISIQKSGEKFKPGLPYKVTAIVKLHDKNAPVTDSNNPLKLTTKFYYDEIVKCKRHTYKKREIGNFGAGTYQTYGNFDSGYNGWYYPWPMSTTTTPTPFNPFPWQPRTTTPYNNFPWTMPTTPTPYNPFPWQPRTTTPYNNFPWPMPTTTTTTWRPPIRHEEEYDCREEKTRLEEKQVYVKNGKAELELDIPKNIDRIDVEAKYFDTVESIQKISKQFSESKEYIQAKLPTENPSMGNKIEIEVRSTIDLEQLSYQVISSGSVVKSESVSMPKTKLYVLSFDTTEKMAPKSQVIIYYLANNGEIISHKVEIELENELKNQIDVQLSKSQAKPGEDIEISIKTQPNSFVGILGVDQSVLVLKKGNDIEKSEVMDELEKYNEGIEVTEHGVKNYRDFTDALIITNVKAEYRREIKLPLKSAFEYDSFDRPYYERNGGYPGFGGFNPYGGFGGSFSGAVASSAQSFSGGSSGGGGFSPSFQSSGGGFGQSPLQSNYLPMSTSIPASTSVDEEDEPQPKRQNKPKLGQKPIEIRTVFPETWMFDSLEIASNETMRKVLTKKVPDTITSWIITGFSLNPKSGLGLTREASKLNVFQPFFVSTHLPYSVKRGEVAAIPIVVFNYMESDQEVGVTLFNKDQEFEFVEVNEEENQVQNKRRKRSLESQRIKRVFVKSNEGATVKYLIRPLKTGHVTVKVTAESNIAGDGVEQQLLVIPEGVTQFMNEAVLVDLKNNGEFKTSIDIEIPDNAVQNSTKIEAAVTGDLLGPSIENLDKLIKLPYGCGEQNMLNFVPNIVVLDYLTSVKLLTPEIEKTAIGYLESGYQRELGYKHDDGSYSAFGKGDRKGSTWLTAFVAKSFNQASKYIHIDQKIINQALNFLSKVQKSDGSFPEVGSMLSKSMQGGASKGIALTAYTLITFLENKKQAKQYSETIDKAIDYILSNMDELKDNYSLAIASYALQLAENQAKSSLIDKLDIKADKDVDAGLIFWRRESDNGNSKKPNSINIEMTAYALQAFIEANRDADALLIGKWLVTQRNENGGFQSTQDTVVGIQALAKLAEKIYSSQSDLNIELKTDAGTTMTMNVNDENALVLQKFELPSSARHFDITANGNGISMLQISYRYNIDDTLKRPQFTLTPRIESSSNQEFLHLSVCTKFISDTQSDESNMAVMEVTLPSGFTFDTDHMKELKSSQGVKKVEVKDGDTIVIIYFDNIDENEICPEIKAYRTHGVAKQKPSPIIIYDYYDNSRQARAFYNPPEVSLCDICDDEDECREVCEVSLVEIE